MNNLKIGTKVQFCDNSHKISMEILKKNDKK